MAAREHTPISNDDLIFALQERASVYDRAWRAFDAAQESVPRNSIAFEWFYRQSTNSTEFHEILNEAILSVPASTVTGALIQLRAIEYLQEGDESDRKNMLAKSGFASIGIALESTLSPDDRKRLGFKPELHWGFTNHVTDVEIFRRSMEAFVGPTAYEPPKF